MIELGLLMAFLIVKYGIPDIMAAQRGDTTSRAKDKAARQSAKAQEMHARRMANLGPTIGQALRARIAKMIAGDREPKPAKPPKPPGVLRRIFGEFREDVRDEAYRRWAARRLERLNRQRERDGQPVIDVEAEEPEVEPEHWCANCGTRPAMAGWNNCPACTVAGPRRRPQSAPAPPATVVRADDVDTPAYGIPPVTPAAPGDDEDDLDDTPDIPEPTPAPDSTSEETEAAMDPDRITADRHWGVAQQDIADYEARNPYNTNEVRWAREDADAANPYLNSTTEGTTPMSQTIDLDPDIADPTGGLAYAESDVAFSRGVAGQIEVLAGKAQGGLGNGPIVQEIRALQAAITDDALEGAGLVGVFRTHVSTQGEIRSNADLVGALRGYLANG